MRTDAKIDGVQVRVPNVPFLGYNKPFAQKGDIVVWNDDGSRRVCRVAGRVHFAPATPDGTREIRDWLFLVALSDSLSDLWVRWVPPEEIEECFSMEDYASRIRKTLDKLLDPTFRSKNPYDIAADLDQ